MEYILLAIPFFLLLIFIEAVVNHFKKSNYYRLNDAVTSLNAGIISRVDVVFRQIIPFAIYAFMYKSLAIFQIDKTPAMWVAAFVLFDFCYYWKHRYNHELNIMWASHVAHHSSEEYNLTTALRQSSTDIFGVLFYLPMAILGFDPVMLFTVFSLNLIYQFWVHTRLVPKLGWYEKIFITPSNHRVHHAMNDIYIDKNYGGVFILWDKWFGTYQEELDEEPCIYGIRKPLKSWDPLWLNFHYYVQLFKDAWHTKSWRDKLLIWIKPPKWRPDDVAEKFPLATFEKDKFEKFEIAVSPVAKWYSLVHHFILSGIVIYLMKTIDTLPTAQQLIWGGYVLFSGFSIGRVLSGSCYAASLESSRIILLAILAINLTDYYVPVIFSFTVFNLVFLAITFTARPKVQS